MKMFRHLVEGCHVRIIYFMQIIITLGVDVRLMLRVLSVVSKWGRME